MSDQQKTRRDSRHREKLCRLTRARQERLEKVADLYLRGKSFRTIGELVGVSLAQVQRDLALCKIEWARSTATGIQNLASKEFARLDRIEAEAWRGWERSQAKIVERAREVTKSESGHTTKNLKRSKQGTGDPAFLQIALGCVNQRIRLMDLVKKSDGGSPDDVVIDAVEVIVRNREEAQAMLEFEQFRNIVQKRKD
ncbi:hypothetical protein SH449x_001716 [Pirellulaceae bacterium SH449]